MAVGSFSPSGFSYAQAARGTTAPASQASSSKVASGAVTPSTSVSLEGPIGGNWADDVEYSEGPKAAQPQKIEAMENKAVLAKETAVDRTKAEDKLLNGVSGVSSPEATGSSTASTTTTRDDSPSAPTGSSSDITWDTKSQASEPAWIADRKERQSGQNGTSGSDSTTKGEREGKKDSGTPKEEPKAVVLQEAVPPPVNPWQKRAEEAKAKIAIAPKPVPKPSTNASAQKENQPPATTTQRRPNRAGATARELPSNGTDGAAKPSTANGKRSSETRISNGQGPKPVSREGSTGKSTENSTGKQGPLQNRSVANLTGSLPSVKDEISWPTPETAQDRERKESPEKESDEKRDDDSTPIAKRKKSEWRPMAVTPNVIWETQSMNEPRERKTRAPGSERGGRGGARGRGSVRGGAVATSGGDRHAWRSSPPPSATDGEHAPKAAAQAKVRANATGPVKQNASTPAERIASPAETPARELQVADITEASVQTDSTNVPPETRRARSPKKAAPVQATEAEEISTPAPIPRRSSVVAQSSEGTDNSRGDPPVRLVATEARKEPRNGDIFRDPSYTGAPRGRRNGRGRGGNGAAARDSANGHPFGSTFQNDFNGPPTYGVPPSPSTYSRGHHHFGNQQAGLVRGNGWFRGGARSHSIPIDTYYPRFVSQAYGQPPNHPANINTFIPYDGQIPPMSAILPNPAEAQDQLIMMVTAQLEYYFGVENLIRDIFLRNHMDSQGFVFLDFIANFNRLKQLTSDRDILKTACLNSEMIDIRVGDDGKDRLRKREGWQQFVRPIEERDASAQSEGPQRLQRPERPHVSIPNGTPLQGPYSAGLPTMHQRMSHRSYDSGIPPMMNGFAPQFVPNGDFHGSAFGDAVNGEERRGRSVKSPIYENGVGPADQSYASAEDGSKRETDAFPDEQVGTLGIVVRMSEQQPPYHSATTRTFSNGSIDSRSIASEMDKSTETDGKPLPNGGPHLNGADKLPNLTRHLSPSKARSPEQGPANQEREVCWAKDVNKIPAGTTYEPYTELRLKALEQREHAATGKCPYDMDVLYQFWTHFLCRNFNNQMYSEFRHFALTDARERHNLTGVNNLLKFYAHSLNSFDSIRDRIAKDYVELVKDPPAALEGAAFKQLRSAWRNGALNLKNRKKLSDVMDEEFKVALDRPEA